MESLDWQAAPDDDTLRDAYVIQWVTRSDFSTPGPYEVFGPGFGGRVATGEWHEVRAAILSDMDRNGYWPDVYEVNDHGNVTLLNIHTGEGVASWV